MSDWRPTCLLALGLLLGASRLAAQGTASPPATPNPECSQRILDAEGKPGAPACEPAGRLAFLLRGEGLDLTQLWIAVESGAAQRGVQAVKLAKAPAADSLLYGIIEVTRSGQSGYRINTNVGGRNAKADLCESFGATIPEDWPVVLGALVTSAAQRLTRCVQAAKLR